MSVPDFQSLMRPVLECAADGEVRISDVVEKLGKKFELTEEELNEPLRHGRQKKFANRVHWAKGYLKKADLVEATKHAHFRITTRGQEALADKTANINEAYLRQFEGFKNFRNPEQEFADREIAKSAEPHTSDKDETNTTPDELLRSAYQEINDALSTELLDHVRGAAPAFFEKLIVELLLAMGYGGTGEDAGRALGRTGDNGVDGVIDQDPLGVDQIYIQAKRYADGNAVGPDAIRDFFGALDMKNAHKGIFVTTSTFTKAAVESAEKLSARIVLIDGDELARLMMRYNIGCRYEQTFHLKKIDEDFFE